MSLVKSYEFDEELATDIEVKKGVSESGLPRPGDHGVFTHNSLTVYCKKRTKAQNLFVYSLSLYLQYLFVESRVYSCRKVVEH